MKITTFLIIVSMLAMGCSKPSYKKNEIIKSSEEVAEETPLNQKLSADQQIASKIGPVAARAHLLKYLMHCRSNKPALFGGRMLNVL